MAFLNQERVPEKVSSFVLTKGQEKNQPLKPDIFQPKSRSSLHMTWKPDFQLSRQVVYTPNKSPEVQTITMDDSKLVYLQFQALVYFIFGSTANYRERVNTSNSNVRSF